MPGSRKRNLTADDMTALAGRLLKRGINRISGQGSTKGQATQQDLRTAARLIQKLAPLVREHFPNQRVEI
jgi:hypothetical protein